MKNQQNNQFTGIKSEEDQNLPVVQYFKPTNSVAQNSLVYRLLFKKNLVTCGVILIILILIIILAVVLYLYFRCAFPHQNELRSQFNKYVGYWYGDEIDFSRLPKRLRDMPDTNLTYDNIEKAALFFNLLGKNIEQNQNLKKIAQMEIQYYDKKYQITKYEQEIQICILVMSYNNQAQNRYKANLDSIFQQNYENYFVIYVNDKSTDQTGALVQKYMDQHPIAKEKMTLINNTENMGKSKSRYVHGHQYCKPGSIMFPFDGDDNLIGRQVFKLLNALYQKRQVRFLYLNFLYFTKYKPSEYMLLTGHSKNPQQLKKDRSYRKGQIPLHLISWMTDIFLAVKQQDYKFKGEFVREGQDTALYYTLEELSGQKVDYVPEIVYNYNDDTGNNDDAYPDRVAKRWAQAKQIKARQKFPVYEKNITYRLKKPSKSFKKLS